MKNKYALTLIVGACALIFAGCAPKLNDKNITNTYLENETQQTVQNESTENEMLTDADISNIINNVTAEELKSVNTDFDTARNDKNFKDTDFVIIDKSEENDAVLYGLYCCNGMVLRVGDDVCPIDKWWLAPLEVVPKLYVQDFDNDNEQEYIIKTHVNTGTGVSGDDLYVAEHVSDKFIISEFEYEDWNKQLMSHISWEYDDEWGMLSTYIDGKPSGAGLFLSKYLEENQWTFDSLGFGSIMEFICHGSVGTQALKSL